VIALLVAGDRIKLPLKKGAAAGAKV
jgi:hypothetical protein